MATLTQKGLQDTAAWQAAQVTLPGYDVAAMAAKTTQSPAWLHFGAGNIFRGYIAALADTLLAKGEMQTGIIAAETYDEGVIDEIYTPFDNLALLVTLNADGTAPRRVIASIAQGLDMRKKPRLQEIFEQPSLQMVSFTITEKGYATAATMKAITELLYARYKAGAYPVAMVSMDNCSKNGQVLKSAVLAQAEGFADAGFTAYLSDESKVAFPWSMIDKITPRPAEAICNALIADGIENMVPVITQKGTYIAPYVNAEGPQYLVIEDTFPAGRPPLEKAGVYMTDREHVNRVERMKVTTCLNPLHTGLAVFGCLLNCPTIASEMGDDLLVKLVKRIGYVEGLPVVDDPGIINPKSFIDEVVQQRLPNPYLPDTPQRIATDTSQKIAIRFGETIKAYMAKGSTEPLVAIPLVLAGWLRYLQGVDDAGNPMEVSSDPRLVELQTAVKTDIAPLLRDASIFGVDLESAGLADKVTQYYKLMQRGNGAVRKTLEEELP